MLSTAILKISYKSSCKSAIKCSTRTFPEYFNFKIQKRAARVILDADNRARPVPLFNRLKWIPFYEEAKINRHCILFKRVHGNLPEYMYDILIRNCDIHKRSTRYNDLNFICPRYKFETKAGTSFTSLIIQTLHIAPCENGRERRVWYLTPLIASQNQLVDIQIFCGPLDTQEHKKTSHRVLKPFKIHSLDFPGFHEAIL